MENIENFDSSYSPSERMEDSPFPECEDCGDSGMVHVGENSEDFCVCEVGHAVAQDFLASMNEEPCEPDDWADGDALASCGMGTDEDYGCYDSGDYF